MIRKIFEYLHGMFTGSTKVITPTVIQLEATECAAVCLDIILRYYFKYVPSVELREKCGVSRDGSSAYNLVEACKYYGLETKPFYANISELKTEINYPAILWWDASHFIVLEGFWKDTFYINDPASGRQKINVIDFEKKYCGVAITLNPGKTFMPQGKKQEFFSLLLNRTKGFTVTIIALVILLFMTVFSGVATAVFSQIFIDEFMAENIPDWTKGYLLSLAALIFFTFCITLMQGYLFNRLARKVSISTSMRFLWHLLKLPISFFHQRSQGEIIRRITLNTEVSNFIISEVSKIVVNSGMVLTYALFIYLYDPLMCMITISAVLANVILIVLVNRSRADAYASMEQHRANFAGATVNTIQNMEAIQAVGGEDYSFKHLIGTYTKIATNNQVIGKKDAIINLGFTLASQFSMIAILGFGSWRIMNGALTIGMLLALQLLTTRLMQPVNSFVLLATRLPTLKLDLMRLQDVLETPAIQELSLSGANDDDDLRSLERGDVEFSNVTFGYLPLDNPLIANFNLSIPSGTILGVTGPNGAGKSTVGRLVLKLYEPWEGEIKLAGTSIETTPYDLLRKNISLVTEDPLFFSGSIKENLTFFIPQDNDIAMIEACKQVEMHDEIMKRQQGYYYHMCENAADFSQGQKQRLAIARALMIQPKILVLDEALNGLEERLQKTIIQNLQAFGITLIIISHRLSLLELCKEIIVVDQGTIVQKDPPEALKFRQGYFQQMYIEEERKK